MIWHSSILLTSLRRFHHGYVRYRTNDGFVFVIQCHVGITNSKGNFMYIGGGLLGLILIVALVFFFMRRV